MTIQHNCLSYDTAADEMQAVADMNARVKDPVYHLIMSWQADENPSDEQMFDSALHVMKAMGMEGHQYLAAIHRDTNNNHIHIAVNRVHHETLAAVYPHRDFYKLDYAMRELEIKHGFKHDNGPYAVFEMDGEKKIDWARQKGERNKKPQQASDMEAHGDEESFYSYLKGEPKKALLAALKKPDLTWQDLHAVLAKYNVVLKPKGQGFAVYDLANEKMTPVKASAFHESLSKKRIEARLGEYVEPVMVKPVEPEAAYKKPKRDPAEREQRKIARAEARRDLYARYKAYKDGLPIFVKENPDRVKLLFAAITHDAKQQRIDTRAREPDAVRRKAMYSLIALQSLQKKEALKRQIKGEREQRKKDREKVLTFQSWVEEQAATGDLAAISQLRGWRYKEKCASDAVNGATPENGTFKEHLLDADLSYQVLRNGSVEYRHHDKLFFTDHGHQIRIADSVSDPEEAIIAMLKLAQEKFGGAVKLTGTQEFKDRVMKIMVDRQLSVKLRDAQQQKEKDNIVQAVNNKKQKPRQ